MGLRIRARRWSAVEQQREDLGEDEEPVSPAARMFLQPRLSCTILCIIDFQDSLDVAGIKHHVLHTLAKHKRFSSILRVDGSGHEQWTRTQVNIEEHFTVAELSPEDLKSDCFVEDYAAALAAPPLDPAKPLWEIHLLNFPSRDSQASCVLRVHHSLGDGTSLMSLLVASLRKLSDPKEVPNATLRSPNQPKKGLTKRLWNTIWTILAMLWYTITEVGKFIAICLFLRDHATPIKGSAGVERMPKKIASTDISLEDMKTVKKAVNGTINDVMLGVVSAGITRYLHQRSPKQSFKGIRIHAAALVNTRESPGLQEIADMMKRSSKARWGNQMGYLIIPVPLEEHEDPLDHVRQAKKTSSRKKLSLEAPLTYIGGSFVMKLFGAKAAANLTYRTLVQTTMSISNMIGPLEPVMLDQNQVLNITPTVVGHPQALCIHFQTYAGKARLVATVAKEIIPDPQVLLQYCKDALDKMKKAVKPQ